MTIISVQKQNAELLIELGFDGYMEVEGTVVGGEDGVFATWRTKRESGLGDLIHLAAGDDGHWWEIGTYDEYWLPQIIEALRSA